MNSYIAEEYGRDIKIAAVIGFPLGASTTFAKTMETLDLTPYTDEFDMVCFTI
jgi:deoxyribose-phosphate aldolase